MLLIFDYDGVIVDSCDLLLDICTEAQSQLNCGRVPTLMDFQTSANLTFNALGQAIGIPDNKLALFEANIFKLQQEKWQVKPFLGMIDLLLEQAKTNILTVVTASNSLAVKSALIDLGLKTAINQVMGGESGIDKATQITKLQKMYSFPLGETFMIGDTRGDIRAGKIAGVYTIAVTWGYQSFETLHQEKPDMVVDSPQKLHQFFKTIKR